jgi:hypothetical protein
MARGRTSSLVIVLSPTERETLERWQRSTTMAAGLARRGQMLLLLADRYSPSQVAQLVGVHRGVVRKWARRVLAQRLAGLADAPGRGAKGGYSPRGRDPRGPPGLRAPGSAGPQSLPVGLSRTGAAAQRGGDRCRDRRRHRAPNAGRASTATLAPACLALSHAAAGGRLLCHRVGAERPLHAAAASGCAGMVGRRADLPAAATASLPDPASPTADHSHPARARVDARGGPQSRCRL